MARRPKGELGGSGGMADTLVLGTSALCVWVQVPRPPPFMSRVAVGGRNARVHTIVGGWRLHISRILYGCLGSIDLVSSKEQGFNSPTVDLYGLLAQLGERLPCKQEVVGSIPTGSTIVPY